MLMELTSGDILHSTANFGIGLLYILMPLSGTWGRTTLLVVKLLRGFIFSCGVGHILVGVLFIFASLPIEYVTGWHYVTWVLTAWAWFELKRNNLQITAVHKIVLDEALK